MAVMVFCRWSWLALHLSTLSQLLRTICLTLAQVVLLTAAAGGHPHVDPEVAAPMQARTHMKHRAPQGRTGSATDMVRKLHLLADRDG
jgi:hypothetical protein